MFNFTSSARSGFFRSRFLIFFFLIILACFLVILYADRIAAFSINNFTDHRLTYARWGRNPFDRSEVEGVKLELNDRQFAVAAEKVRFDLKAGRFLEQRQFVLRCEMEGVTFPFVEEGRPELAPHAEGSDSSSSDDILAIPFGPDQKYERMIFTVFLDKDTVKIAGFEAYSKDVRMKGDYAFHKKKDEISIDLKISFSPDASDAFANGIKENILSPDEGGWYSTIISYKGNPAFLRALSVLVTPSAGG